MSQPLIEIYTTTYCPYCVRAKALLDEKSLTYTEISVENEPELRQTMESRAGRHTVPQIFIGDQHIGGCDDLYALENAGKLDPLLNQ